MHSSLGALVLLAAFNGGTREATIYDDYRQAYFAAKATHRPLLVVLNPPADADSPAVDVEVLRRSSYRRELLGEYVVAVIDVSTPAGQATHKQFKSPTLPGVSVIDKQQKWQLYRDSKPLAAEDWNLLLEKYRKGVAPPPARGQCLT